MENWKYIPDEYNRKTGRIKKDVPTVRAKNPGAVFYFDDWQGIDKIHSTKEKLAWFADIPYGVRAQVKTLLAYQKKHGLKTPRTIITRYAPPDVHDNHTEAYFNFVSEFLGITPDTILDFVNDRELLARFAYAQHIVEAGFAWVEFQLFKTQANVA